MSNISGRLGMDSATAVEYLNEVFATIGYDMKAVSASNGIDIMDSDETITYASLYNTTGTLKTGYTLFYNNGESNVQVNRGNGTADTFDVRYSSNGILLHYYKASEITYQVDMFITKNSDGKIIIGAMQRTTSYLTNTVVYDYPTLDATTYVYNDKNNTALLNMIFAGDNDKMNVCEYCFAMVFRTYNNSGTLTLNGEEYVTNGYWCIKD